MTLNNTSAGFVKISGSLDITEANLLRDGLLASFAHQTRVTADLSGVESCDAAALQVLLAAVKNGDSGKALRFRALSPAITETAAALGLEITEESDSQ